MQEFIYDADEHNPSKLSPWRSLYHTCSALAQTARSSSDGGSLHMQSSWICNIFVQFACWPLSWLSCQFD